MTGTDERARAEACIARLSRDETDRQLLHDTLFGEAKIRPPRGTRGRPTAQPKKKPTGISQRKHGTVRTYKWELANGVGPCQSCENAFAEQQRDVKAAKEKRLKPCGTQAAWQRHKRRGEPIDDACRTAHNKHRAERRTVARVRKVQAGPAAPATPKPEKAPRQLRPCGTSAALRRHHTHGEPTDEACRASVRNNNRTRSARQRAKKKGAMA